MKVTVIKAFLNGGNWAMPNQTLNVPDGRAKDLAANGLVALPSKGAEGTQMQSKPERHPSTKPARAPSTKPSPAPETAKSPPVQTQGGTNANPNA
ncbi:hypothetical protein [Achromobacter sp. Bel]|uniref:hypothetical protein n=1 Tax=Achromobacter sp. Bel TaxID=2727415 RepID=UPI00145DA839|nr:hypothetical protein [Achromobacter sp. Bel]NMK45527.1 hypothetical protein [Achromobacter sp. Bel]